MVEFNVPGYGLCRKVLDVNSNDLRGQKDKELTSEDEHEEDDAEAQQHSEKQRWQAEQQQILSWQAKELSNFLEEAVSLGVIEKDGVASASKKGRFKRFTVYDQQPLLQQVREVHEKVIRFVLAMTKDCEWKDAIGFLSKCPQSVNARPAFERYGFIHYASAQGDLPTIKRLLHIGSQVKMLSHCGKSPCQVALEHGHAEVARYLREVEDSDFSPRRSGPLFAGRQIGSELKGPMVFKRTSQTLYEAQTDACFSTFSKISSRDAWDAHASSCIQGVTTIEVQARQCNGPLIFGLTSCTEDNQTFPNGFSVLFGQTRGFETEVNLNRGCIVEDIEICDTLKMVAEGSAVKVFRNNTEIRTFNVCPQGFYAKLFVFKGSDALMARLEPLVSIPQQLKLALGFRSGDFQAMLKGVLMKLLPSWLRKEVEQGVDPADRSGHVMYFSSLIVSLTTRSWTEQELADMDDVERKNHLVAFNYEWTTDLWKVLKKVWNDGGIPKLANLRAKFHTKIPGSCKNKSLLALTFVNSLKPEHRWLAWTVWRERTEKEAMDRFPNKPLNSVSFAQLHSVCCHRDTALWFDVIRFWDRDPYHKRRDGLPDPHLINEPNPSNFDLKRHTEWLQNEAGPGGAFGYSCPLQIRGVAPRKLALHGVIGEHQRSPHDSDEEEED